MSHYWNFFFTKFFNNFKIFLLLSNLTASHLVFFKLILAFLKAILVVYKYLLGISTTNKDFFTPFFNTYCMLNYII